ncbi:hypothetical protein TrVE_jg12420 [Triparma verrucosa]|uniref:Uncharacterized protein n=1 Tax=Triparma verrucosa TaxID=1606542 RepID=A0A9W7CFI5_9STRA|nr:hypothetical protein TrVE_jg12420 [Triparma verrucosa]
MISYDWDTSPSQRSTASFAYGYVPDKAWRNVGLYFLYKIIRRDFYYYLNMSGLLRLVVSVFERFVGKVLVDFTMLIHMRRRSSLAQVKTLLGGEEER